MLHNVLLSAGSAILLLLMIEEVRRYALNGSTRPHASFDGQLLPIVYNHGPFAGICANESWTPVRLSILGREPCVC